LLCCLAVTALCGFEQGCASLTNPTANGIPVRKLPPELLAESKQGSQTLPLSVLRQKQPPAHRIGPDDVLGIWVEGILGEKDKAPPLLESRTGLGSLPPALGFPIPVRSDGTISLPFIDLLKVDGMTLEEAQTAVFKAYTGGGPEGKQIIQKDRAKILVTLQRPRHFRVLVIRQDAGTAGSQGGVTSIAKLTGGGVQGTKRGTGFAIDLPVYKNDVLNALAQTGGLPGTDSVNEIIVERGGLKKSDAETLLQNQAAPGQLDQLQGINAPGTERIRIPLRLRPGEQFSIRPEDVILQDGDIVLIQAREQDVFYTAGILPPGEFELPRDVDLDIVQAITRITGPMVSGGLGTVNFQGQTTTSGLGNPSPSLVSIVRQTPGGGQVTIRVDLNLALRDPRERILIQPRDIIILQERPEESITRYISGQIQFTFFQQIINTAWTTATGTFHGP
jgi:protein involved in polysaccharide export with SLBB domain